MPLSSRMTRAVRTSVVLGTAAAAAIGLAGCKVPAFETGTPTSQAAQVVPEAGAGTGSAGDSAPGTPSVPPAGAPDPGSAAGSDPGSAAGSGQGSGGSDQGSGGSGRGSGGSGSASGGVSTPGDPVLASNGRMYIGSVAGGYQQALAGTGVQLADHAYAFFTSKVPQAAMITVSAGNTKWADVAAAGPGSALYNQIVSWAQTIKARPGKIMVAYNHEPEGHDRLTLGSPADFIDAYRHVETIFDQQGATNVIWTWQMTAYAFSASPSSDQYAAKWYPGDQWIDNVGADAYNWMGCGSSGGNQYRELQQIGDPMLAFARAHGKQASFPEFASDANPNRTQWLQDAHQYFVQNQDVLTAAFYFNRPPTVQANSGCKWGLTTSSEYGALRQMAQDTAHFMV